MSELNEQSGEDVAAIAGRGMNNPEELTLEEIRSVCGSVVSQRRVRVVNRAVETIQILLQDETPQLLIHRTQGRTPIALSIELRSVRELARQCRDILRQ